MNVTRHIIWSAVGAAIAAGAVSLIFAGSDDGVSISIYLAAVGAVVITQVVRWPGGRWRVDQRAVAPLLARRPPTPARSSPGPVTELEGLLAEGANSGRAAERRLRPRLLAITEARLLDRRGVHLSDQPQMGRALLGPDAWRLIDPDHDPEEPIDPGAVDLLVQRLENL